MAPSSVAYDVVVVGSANLDLVVGAARLPHAGETVLGESYAEHAGGKGLNQAIAAASAGASVAFVGAVGGDEPGERLRRAAGSDNVDTTHLARVDDALTGRAMITVDTEGENTIVVIPGANQHVALGDGSTLPTGRVMLSQLEIPVEQALVALRTAQAAGSLTILNPAPARVLPGALLAACDIVVPNEHEVELIGGVDALLEQGVGAVVVTLGAAGVAVAEAGASARQRWTQPAFDVVPIDSTGAGDAFCGALAARLATGSSLADAVAFAAAAGALATTVAGAVPSLPRIRQIEDFLHARQSTP